MANLKRWKELEDNPDWNARTELISDWLTRSKSILDVGCGTGFIRSLLSPSSRYIGIDVVPRGDDCVVIDLNETDIPSELMKSAEVVTFMGVLEYLNDPARHIKLALRYSSTVIFSYTPSDYVPDKEERRQNDWISDLNLNQLNVLIDSLGAHICFSKRFNSQVVYVVTNGEAEKTKAPTVKTFKQKIVLSGFFGRGNVGDEAILQSVYEEVKSNSDLEPVVTIDRDGAFDGFWDWYPYNEMEIIHHNNLTRIAERDIYAIHMGGGGLPLGFNAGQASIAHLLGKKVAMTGIDDPFSQLRTVEGFEDTNARKIFDVYEHVSIRFQAQLDSLRKTLGRDEIASLGTDWAIDFKKDESSESVFEGIYLSIRELPIKALTPDSFKLLDIFFKAILDIGVDVRLLPCCPEDERFLAYLRFAWDMEVVSCWWNPRKMKELISKSFGIISLGRLHPTILASTESVNNVSININGLMGDVTIPKLEHNAAQLGLAYFHSIGAFIESFVFHPSVRSACNLNSEKNKMVNELFSYLNT